LADYDDENEFHIPNRLGISTQCWGDEFKGTTTTTTTTAATTMTTLLLVDTFIANTIIILWQRTAKALTTSLMTSCVRLDKNVGWLQPSNGIIKGMTEAVMDQGTANYVGYRISSPCDYVVNEQIGKVRVDYHYQCL
jgi:hypothetical protein